MSSSLRVERQTAPVRAQVAAKLRSAILEQRFAEGDRLIERELCELTGTSRSSVREALRQLEAEGLVEITHHGPTVARISPEDAREIYEVRMALEGLAGRLCAEHADQEHLDALEAARLDIEAAVKAGDPAALAPLKDVFYQALFRGAANSLIERTVESLRIRITALRVATLSQPRRAETTLDEINAIVTSIVNRDPDAAEETCRAHVAAAAHVALDWLSARHSNER